MLRFRIITFFKLMWQTCSQSVERVRLSGIKPKEWAERCCKAQDEWGIAWSGNSHLIHCSYRNIDYSSFKYHPPPQIKWFFKTFNIWSYHLVYVRHHKELLHYPLLASLLQSRDIRLWGCLRSEVASVSLTKNYLQSFQVTRVGSIKSITFLQLCARGG